MKNRQKTNRRPVSIRQVARETGFTHTTAAYVLKGKAREYGISEETELKVRKTAEELGWQPNYMLTAFASGKTRLIGVWQAKIGEPYNAWVTQAMERVLHEDNYAMLLSTTQLADDDNQRDLGMFNRWSVEGLVCLEGERHIRRFLDTHANWNLPVIDIGTHVVQDSPLVNSVYVDVLTGARTAMDKWVEKGRRRIAMLSGYDFEGEGLHPREKLYRQFIQEWGLSEEMITFAKGSSQRDSAEATLRQYIMQHGCPGAIFCHSDETLTGAYRAVRDLGYTLPQDVALLGIDGIRDLHLLDQPVSTVVQPVEEMCRLAWEILQERFENPQMPARHEMLHGTLQWQQV